MRMQEFVNQKIVEYVTENKLSFGGEDHFEFIGRPEGWLVFKNEANAWWKNKLTNPNPWPEKTFDDGMTLIDGWSSVCFEDDLLDKIASLQASVKRLKAIIKKGKK